MPWNQLDYLFYLFYTSTFNTHKIIWCNLFQNVPNYVCFDCDLFDTLLGKWTAYANYRYVCIFINFIIKYICYSDGISDLRPILRHDPLSQWPSFCLESFWSWHFEWQIRVCYILSDNKYTVKQFPVPGEHWLWIYTNFITTLLKYQSEALL